MRIYPTMLLTILNILLMVITSYSAGIIATRNIYPQLLVGSLNVQNLGNTKFGKPEVMDVIKKIIIRYDLICIQEIVTQNEVLMQNLLQGINNLSAEVYEMKLSERLGRDTTAKEQYACLYRTNRFQVLDEQVYPDPDEVFVRPPYILHMKSTATKYLSSFVVSSVHTKPTSAAKEVDALADVYDYVTSYYKNENSIILGDFNAACNGVRASDWPNISLWTRSEFLWLINDSIDTSTFISSCANDRIVIAGNKIKQDAISYSAKSFDFPSYYGLSEEEARAVSDHYPVEVLFRGNVSEVISRNVGVNLCIDLYDNRPSSNPKRIYETRDNFNFTTVLYKDENGNDTKVTATKTNSSMETLLSSLRDLMKRLPSTISEELFETLEYKAKHDSLSDPGSYNDVKEHVFRLSISCDLPTNICSVQLCRDTYYN